VLALRVGGTLAALGVPAQETVTLVVATVQAEGGDVAVLPQVVQAAIARGATPAQAGRLARDGRQRDAPLRPRPDRPRRPVRDRPSP